MTAVATQYAKIQKLGAEILAISVDTVFAHKTWHEQELSKMVKGGIPYPMLSDPGGKLGTTYEVYNPEAGLHNRGQFIIDPDGIIQAIEVLNAPVGVMWRNCCGRLKHFNASGNQRGLKQYLQAGSPGKKTLKPGPDLVCKVCTVWESD